MRIVIQVLPGARRIRRIALDQPQESQRADIAFDPAPLQKILKNRSFTTLFGSLQGEQLKTAPRGFDDTHEAIDLLRHKQFLLIRRFEDQEVLGPDFLKEANRTYKGMRPFFDYMSVVLTTDSNGLDR